MKIVGIVFVQIYKNGFICIEVVFLEHHTEQIFRIQLCQNWVSLNRIGNQNIMLQN